MPSVGQFVYFRKLLKPQMADRLSESIISQMIIILMQQSWRKLHSWNIQRPSLLCHHPVPVLV